MFGSKTSRVPSYTFSWTFTYSTGTTVGSTYMATRDGTQLNNGVSLQFDEQSTVTWGSQFESGIYYNGSVIYNLVIGIVDPVRSISVGSLVF